MKELFQNRRMRVFFLTVALVFFSVILGSVLFWPKGKESYVYQHIMSMVKAGENHDLAGVMKGFAPTIRFSMGGTPRDLSNDELAGLGQGLLDAHPYINIRPQNSEIVVGLDEQQTVVDFYYHWSVSSAVLPNVRGRSEDLYENHRPQQARLVLEKEGESWLVTELYLGLEK
jgi:hypothetical protein